MMEDGSSPQVRGKLCKAIEVDPTTRLIPAGAGKTEGNHEEHRLVPAHPRRCGENGTPLRHACRKRGSSPQVRGKLADMELYPHKASFRISLEPKASINPT